MPLYNLYCWSHIGQESSCQACVSHVYNPSTGDAESGGLRTQGQHGLNRKTLFQKRLPLTLGVNTSLEGSHVISAGMVITWGLKQQEKALPYWEMEREKPTKHPCQASVCTEASPMVLLTSAHPFPFLNGFFGLVRIVMLLSWKTYREDWMSDRKL